MPVWWGRCPPHSSRRPGRGMCRGAGSGPPDPGGCFGGPLHSAQPGQKGPGLLPPGIRGQHGRGEGLRCGRHKRGHAGLCRPCAGGAGGASAPARGPPWPFPGRQPQGAAGIGIGQAAEVPQELDAVAPGTALTAQVRAAARAIRPDQETVPAAAGRTGTRQLVRPLALESLRAGKEGTQIRHRSPPAPVQAPVQSSSFPGSIPQASPGTGTRYTPKGVCTVCTVSGWGMPPVHVPVMYRSVPVVPDRAEQIILVLLHRDIGLVPLPVPAPPATGPGHLPGPGHRTGTHLKVCVPVVPPPGKGGVPRDMSRSCPALSRLSRKGRSTCHPAQ